MMGTIMELVVVGILLLAVVACALAPVGFLGMMFWRWHRELSRLRAGRQVRLTAVPMRRPVRSSVLVLATERADRLDRRAS